MIEPTKKAWKFVEEVAQLRISGEVGCPDCGGPLGEEGLHGRECLNCSETWPLYKLDEWRADEAFDSEEALNRLIGDARDLWADYTAPTGGEDERGKRRTGA
jgi:hypothetical protein